MAWGSHPSLLPLQLLSKEASWLWLTSLHVGSSFTSNSLLLLLREPSARPTLHSTLPTPLLLGEATGKQPVYAAANLEKHVIGLGGWVLDRSGEGSGMEVFSPTIPTHLLGCKGRSTSGGDQRHTGLMRGIRLQRRRILGTPGHCPDSGNGSPAIPLPDPANTDP